MSNRVRVLSVLLASGLLAGCGGSSGGSVDVTAKVPTSAEGLDAAAAINLKASDMPGYKAEPADNSSDGKGDKEEAAFGACVGAEGVSNSADDITDESSDDFSKGGLPSMLTVSSSVGVVTSADIAKADLKAFQSAKAADCFKTFVQSTIGGAAGTGVTFSDMTVDQLTPAGAGTEGTFGFKLTASLSALGQSIPFQMSIEGALKDHTEVTLLAFSMGAQSLSDSERDALFASLITRLKVSAV